MNENANSMTAAPAALHTEDVLIILPVRDVVLFPGVVLPIAVTGKRALAAAQEAVRTQRRVGFAAASRRTGRRIPTPSSCTGRHRRLHRALRHRGGRHASSDRPGRAALHGARLREPRAVPGGPHRGPQGSRRQSTARSRRAGSPCASGPSRPCSSCRRRPPNSSTRSAPSSRSATLADIVASFMDLKIDGETGNPGDLRPRRRASTACSRSSTGASRC